MRCNMSAYRKTASAAVYPKSDQVFLSGGCECSSVLPLRAPTKQAHRAEAGGEKGESGWQWDNIETS
jgi:hypothetical protein